VKGSRELKMSISQFLEPSRTDLALTSDYYNIMKYLFKYCLHKTVKYDYILK